MAAIYTDHRILAPVLYNIRHHVHSVFAGEPLHQTTLNQIQAYLERTVQGSRWTVNISPEYDLALSVRFDTAAHITFYRVRWS